jgi:hypothetical protein
VLQEEGDIAYALRGEREGRLEAVCYPYCPSHWTPKPKLIRF